MGEDVSVGVAPAGFKASSIRSAHLFPPPPCASGYGMTHVWLKTLVGQHFNLYLLAVVLLILAAGVGASLLASRRERAKKESVARPNAA